MGTTTSRTRRVTIENDNPMSVIKVSEDVVQRMKGAEGQAVRKQAQEPAAGDAPYLYQPSLTSLQIRQASIQALKENDDYWDKRIQQLQLKHQEMQNIMEEEYAKAMEELAIKKTKKEVKSVPCLNNRKQIIACYKKYKDEPMKCAKEVQQFADCVDQNRVNMIANKG